MSMISAAVINQKYGGMNPTEFGRESCAPSHAWGPAVRPCWMLHYIVSGFGEFSRDGSVYRLGPGQMFVIPPYTEACYKADRGKPWHYIWIGFTTEEPLPDALRQPVISCPEIMDIFEEMSVCIDMERGRGAYLTGCLWKLIGTLLEHGAARPDYVDKAVNCMNAEFASGINVREVANRIGLDRSYFCTLFSKKMGMPPGEYLISLRLTRAAELMASQGASPSVAAESVGYRDLCHFSKIFKKRFGVTPRGYMRGEKAG